MADWLWLLARISCSRIFESVPKGNKKVLGQVFGKKKNMNLKFLLIDYETEFMEYAGIFFCCFFILFKFFFSVISELFTYSFYLYTIDHFVLFYTLLIFFFYLVSRFALCSGYFSSFLFFFKVEFTKIKETWMLTKINKF